MQIQTLDPAFQALAEPTRRALLARIAENPATVAELAAPFAISQPAISRHLKVLEQAGLITARIDGPRRPREIVPERLADMRRWLAELEAAFEARFQRLDAVLDEMEASNDP